MKQYALLPLILLCGCAPVQSEGEYFEDDYGMIDSEESGVVSQQRDVIAVEAPIAQKQPVRQQAVYQQSVYQGQSVMQQPNNRMNGQVIELPAQQIYIPDIPVRSYQQRVLSETVRQPYAGEVYAKSVSYQQQVTPNVITLQYPGRPDVLVQCMANDATCLMSYKQQGFRQVRYVPQVAGYHEVLTPSDYPKGSQWQHQYNIPRW